MGQADVGSRSLQKTGAPSLVVINVMGLPRCTDCAGIFASLPVAVVKRTVTESA
jgi:hypothetical protein